MFEIDATNIYQFSRSTKKQRIPEIDFLRGLCIFLMLLDHFFLIFGEMNKTIFGTISATSSIYMLYRYSVWWWSWSVRVNARIVIICIFFFVSGVSSFFSRNNIRRGLWIFIVSLIINAAMFGAEEYLGISGMITYFGAINCFGVTILIYALYELLMNKLKVKEPYQLRISLIIGLITSLIGFTASLLFDFSVQVSRDSVDFITFIKHVFGFARIENVGDYLQLLPYLGFFFFGAGFAAILYKNKESIFTSLFKYIPTRPKKSEYSNILAYSLSLGVYSIYSVFNSIIFVIKKGGRYSLIIYLLHQFIFLLILFIVMYSLGYSIQF